jgi:membrane protein YdbS with pleckstrin-like domain
MSAEHGDEEARGHHHLRTPTSQLPHAEKIARQDRHIEILSILLLLVLVLLIYSAAFDIDHWAEWIVFGGIVATAVGAGVAINTHGRA